MNAIKLAGNATTCKEARLAYHYALYVTIFYTGQGCEYNLGELGFEQVGVDGCALGKDV